MTMLSVSQAVNLLTAGIVPLTSEDVGLDAAHGRVLAAPILAQHTQPPFDASAMDGFAVRGADIARLPAHLTVTGESAAGLRFQGTVEAGQAVRILTGAPVPEGADAIVIQENTRRDGMALEVFDGSPDRAHIRPRGGDFRRDASLLPAGRRLDARALTLAASGGHATLSVRRKPRIAILATGNELVPPGQKPGPDQIVSSNPAGLAALIRAFGGEPVQLGIAPDDLASIAAAIEQARDADILVTTGGASVGDHDLVRPALESLGVKLEFWRLAMRPGNPVLFGRLSKLRVLGLPGNPVSALLCARVFLCPMMAALLGTSFPMAERHARLAEPLAANGPREHYMRALIREGADGTAIVSVAPNQDSSLLAPLSTSNALIVRPPNDPALQEGAIVRSVLIDF